MKHKNPKSPLLAFLLGMLVPGFGLLYAAPWMVAGIGTVGVLVTMKLLGWIPFIGTASMAVAALGSGALNWMYANAFNRVGHRLEFEIS